MKKIKTICFALGVGLLIGIIYNEINPGYRYYDGNRIVSKEHYLSMSPLLVHKEKGLNKYAFLVAGLTTAILIFQDPLNRDID